jgi:hypothetical protein
LIAAVTLLLFQSKPFLTIFHFTCICRMGRNHNHHDSSSSMNVETSTNHLPSHQHHHPADEHEFSTDRFPIKLEPKAQQSSSSPPPLLGKFLSPLLAQAKGGGLSQIPQSTLYDNLQLVISALENLDAEALLDLETFPSAEQSPPGPRVRDG